MRRIISIALAVMVAILALGGTVVVRGDASSVTRARVERSLPVVFANRYAEQAQLLGRDVIIPASLHARAMCDKHGPDVADVGPGGDWVCLMSWTDSEVPMPAEGHGTFELNVHSNDCYTATGPTKLTGFLMITDTEGKEVTNPVFEFDGCFDPHGDNEATGVLFPSLLTVTSTTAVPGAGGLVALQVTCGTGSQGCSGTISATAGIRDLGTADFRLKEETTATLAVPERVPADAGEVTFRLRLHNGVGPGGPVSLPLEQP